MACTAKMGAVFGTVDLLTYLKIREWDYSVFTKYNQFSERSEFALHKLATIFICILPE